jgi:hypothetical protein
LKQNLASMGVFDQRMALYLFYRLRQHHVMGFTGFEGRYYSLFHQFSQDMGPAVNLQQLITAFACRMIIDGKITHQQIPDRPAVESERRQIIFGTAIGIPTFFVQNNTSNVLMQRILRETTGTRTSRRYPGYIRVHNREYRKALVKILRKDAADLIDHMGVRDTIDDLEQRILDPDHHAASGRLIRGILDHAGARTPFRLNAADFNQSADSYYRTTLRKQHLDEALSVLSEMCTCSEQPETIAELESVLHQAGYPKPISEFLAGVRSDVLNDRIQIGELTVLIHLMILLAGSNQQDRETKQS